MKSKFYLTMRSWGALIALLILSSNAFAQVSQWVYGPNISSTDDAKNGVVMKFTPGQIMCGISESGNGAGVYVVKNDLNGNSTAIPYFNRIINVSVGTATLKVQSAKIVELKHGAGYAIGGVGIDLGTGTNYLFYFKLNALGTLVGVPSVYSIAGSTLDFGSICEDAAGFYLYLTGGISNVPGLPGASSYFVHKIDQTGAISWSNVYPLYGTTNTKAYAAVEDPGATQLALIGTLTYGGAEDGFFSRIDPATGNPLVYYVMVYGGVHSNDRLFSITYSSSDPAGNPRYLVAGMSDVITPNGFDTWVMLLTQGGFKVWSTLVDDNSRLDNGAFHIIERMNTTGALEYYTSGATQVGPFGNADAQMLKGSVATGMPLLLYAYGGPGNDFANCIDYNNGPTGTGLAMFGTTSSFTPINGPREMYFIKTYFNGEVGCNAQEQPIVYQSPLDFRVIFDVNIFTHLGSGPATIDQADATESNLCLDASLPSGNNDLILQDKDVAQAGNTALKISPNPAAQNTSVLLVDADAPAGTTMYITVTDMLGRQFLATSIVAEKSGKQQIPVSVETAGLASGTYIVKLWNTGQERSTVLLVK